METEMETEGERERKEEGTRQIQRAGGRHRRHQLPSVSQVKPVSQDPALRTQCPGLDTRANHAVGSMDESGPGARDRSEVLIFRPIFVWQFWRAVPRYLKR